MTWSDFQENEMKTFRFLNKNLQWTDGKGTKNMVS